MIKVCKSNKEKPNFIWYPEVGERVEVMEQHIPVSLKNANRPVMAKITNLDGQYIFVKFIKEDLYGVFYRNELIPVGNFFYKKTKKLKLK